MKLLTKELRKKLPALRATTGRAPEKIPIICKYFDPTGSWAWYVIEGEPVLDDKDNEIDFEFYGFIRGQANESGYFMLGELETATVKFGLKVERDLYFGIGKHYLNEAIEKRI